MTKMAVVGGSEFMLGFQLAGIKEAIEANKSNILAKLMEAKNKKELSIVVVDEELMEQIDKRDRMEIDASAKPVFIPLSVKATQDNLRQLIKKSIGVDLLA